MDESPRLARGLGRIVSGLFVVTSGKAERATGMLTSFVQQAGFEPPVVTVAIKKGRQLLEVVRECGVFCVSVLHDGSIHLLGHFARGFEPGQDAFRGIEVNIACNGVPYPADAHAFLACRVLGEADWSDHVVVCGEVLDGDRRDDDPPLTHVRKNGLNY